MEHRRVMAAVATAFLLAIAGAAMVHGCGGAPASEPPVAGIDGGDALTDTRQDVDASHVDQWGDEPRDSGTDACSARPFPSYLPKSWEEYSDWSCDCRFYIPGEQGEMPPPIEWSACPATAPANIQCRYMRPFWSAEAGQIDPLTAQYSADPDTGKPMLAFRRLSLQSPYPTAGFFVIVADADGVVHNAFYQDHGISDGCNLTVTSFFGEFFSLDILGDQAHDPHNYARQGAIGARVGEPHPKVIRRHENAQDVGYEVYVSSELGLEWHHGGMLTVFDWLGKGFSEREIYAPGMVPSYLPAMKIPYVESAVIFGVNEGGNTGDLSWDFNSGTRPLLRWYDDSSKGAGCLGTDGKDMVWAQGSGKPPGGSYGDFATVEIMTAPFTTDPATVQVTARRIAVSPNSDEIASPNAQFAVGCGYAARVTRGPCELAVFRLSDGASWHVACPDPFLSWVWERALGVTCDEVFVVAGYTDSDGWHGTIARVALQSLGDPILPDQ